MKLTIFLVAVIVMLGLPAYAQDSSVYQCSLGGMQRRIEIMHEPGVSVPCEVHYYKDTEAPGERQVLWRALNEEGYCEAKTAEFIAMLSGMGWRCDASDAIIEEAEEDVDAGDDTDALTPVG